MVHIQWNINGHKKEWNLTVCNNMDIPRGYHAKWNKSNRDYKYYMISYVKSKITKQNQQTQRKKMGDWHRWVQWKGGKLGE